MSEQNYFDQGSVRVTSARFVVNGTTYPINSIASVRASESKPIPLTAIILIMIGFGILLGGQASLLFFGALAIGLGILWIVKKAKVYSVVLRTSSGESQVLESKDKAHVLSVVEALNTAIVARG